MSLLAAFMRLVRWPNLVFIILTQVLFYYSIYLPIFDEPQPVKLLLITLASVFIAAAGYIINDYFDVNIDQVNKPDKNVVDRIIHRRSAIIWHLVLSLAGVLLTIRAVGWPYWHVVAANLGAVVLLWVYSTSFKKQLLIGNVVISLLTAWTILVLFFSLSSPQDAFQTADGASVKFFRLSFLYAGFAFIISLIREAVKDMEDLKGDLKYHCNTLPVAAGTRATKIYVAVWAMVLLAAVGILQLYVLQFGWLLLVAYSIVFILLPVGRLLQLLKTATSTADFHRLSNFSKLIMLTGIISMIFFRFYF